MFNSTHTLVGFAVAKSGADKWVRYGTATAVIASNLPDIDSIAGFWGFAAYLEHHRGITHSILGFPILALLFSCVMYFFSANFGRTYVIALIAMATHPALDYLTSWGLRPFLPFNHTLYYGDVVFVFDPYLDAVLLLGLLTAWFWPKRKRVVMVTAILIALGYVGVRIELHRLAAARVAEIAMQNPEVERWAVLPRALGLQVWTALTASKTGVSKMDICGVPCPAIETEMSRIMDSAPPSELVAQASKTESAAMLLRFARFPVTRVQDLPFGYRVMFIEAGFLGEGGKTAVAAVITLDKAVQVLSESLSFDQTID